MEVSQHAKPDPPLLSNQGALAACARVSELHTFAHTAEVKVDPDKPLEGARLAVLQVALHSGKIRGNPRIRA